jgi:thioredoxin reductase (NADPH)
VIGGGNSAGQAAVYLAETARRVHVLIRAAGLAHTMSRYLVRRIEDHPSIEVRSHSQLIGLEGNGHLSSCSGMTAARATSNATRSGTCS